MTHDTNPEKTPPDSPPEKLRHLQEQFAGHLRDPEHVDAPDNLEDRRLAIYRRLFFNNLSNLFARNFPVIRRLFDDQAWQAMIRDFMIHHRARTPMFTRIGSEFVRYLAETREREDSDPPFLAELADWEFTETQVRLDEADPTTLDCRTIDDKTALLELVPALNPTTRVRQYQWPVHRIGPDFQPEQPETRPLVLVANRRRNDRVAFMKINPVTARLLQLLDENAPATIQACLEILAGELNQPAAALREPGERIVGSLIDQEIILGSLGAAPPSAA